MDAPVPLPGVDRLHLLQRCADDVDRHSATSFDDEPWSLLAELDERQGFRTRWAARAILQRESDGAVLVFRYSPRAGRERLILPGGGTEPRERFIEGVAREIVEETGTPARTLRSTGLVLAHEILPHADDPRPRLQYAPIFAGSIDDHLPDLGGREVIWHTIDELASHRSAPHLAAAARVLREESFRPCVVWLRTPWN